MIHLRQVLHTLTQPSAYITEPDDRQRAQLLASLTLALIGLGVSVLSVRVILEPVNSATFIQIVFFGIVCLIYPFSRSRYYQTGAWLIVGLAWGSIIFSAALLPAGENVRGLLAYISVVIFLASLLLSRRSLLLVMGICIASILFLPLVSRFQDRTEIFHSVAFTIVLSGMVFVFMRHRDQLEQKRQARLAESEKRHRAMLNAIPDMMFRLSREGVYLDYHARDSADLYAEPTHFLGRNVLDVMPSDIAQRLMEYVQRTLETKALQVFEYDLFILGVVQSFEARMVTSGSDEVTYLVRNITERKRGENVLRESQERWRSLVENMPGYVTHINREGTVLFLNRSEFIDAESAVGTSVFDMLPPEYRDLVRQKVNDVFQTGKPDIYELGTSHPEGGVIWHNIQAAPVWHNGQVDSLIFISTDITESKVAEDALRASESRLRAMNDASPFGIFLTDAQGDCLYTNRVYQQMSGLRMEETLGKGWSRAVHPEDREWVSKNWYDAARERKPYDNIFRYQHIEGVTLWVRERAAEIKDGEVLLGYVGTVEDITERKMVQEALSQERNLLRTVIDHLPDYIFVKDTEGRFTLSNMAHARAAQSSTENLIGKTAFDVFPADAAAQFYSDDETIMHSRQPLINAERMTVNEDGNKRFVLTTKVPLLDSDNAVIGLVGISRDITERKQTEETLAQERNLFRTLIDALPDYIFVKDTQRRFILSNSLHTNLIGCEPDEVIGKTDFDFFPPELCEEYYAGDQEVLRTGQPLLNHEEIIVKATGSRASMLASTSKIPLRDSNGEIIGLVGIARDITERKQAEETLAQERNLLRTLVDAIPDFVYVKDTQSRYILTNVAHAKSMGSTPDDVVGRADIDFFPQELAEIYYADEQEVFRTGNPLLNHEEVSMKETENLTLMIALSSKVPLRNSNGEIVGLVGITRDVTEDKRVASQLEEARDQALESSRLKSEFLATMSHEIRTPMNGVIGMTELLLGTTLDEEQKDYAQIVLGEANSLLTIINDILDFSKIEAGKMIVETIEFTLPNVVKRVVDMMKLKGADKGLSVTMTIAPDVPTYVCGDPNRLRQVLLNLMGNAIKFTRRGAVELHLTLDKHQANHYMVRISIHDSGIGLSEVARKRLFQPFTQADGSTTRKYGGTGLGLVISKRLTELMGGEIGVESEEGVGSTFWFTIQFAKSEQAGPLHNPQMDKVETQPDGDKSDILILVAEDNPTNQSLALKQLRSLGYRARLVGNGVEAVDEIISHPGQYALILMDCQMPIMDGYEATRLIRADETNSERHIPIVALTASATMGIREKCLIAGMDDYLSKPVSLEALQAAIEQCLVEKK
jgi:two-component system sensor histidine kinase/response regulator